MASRLSQRGGQASTMVKKKSRFKNALMALRVSFRSEMLAWDNENDNKPLKAYFEARCLLHNIEVDLNLAWSKFEALDKNVDNFFKSCSCLVSTIGRLENKENNETTLEDEPNTDQLHLLDEKKYGKFQKCCDH